MRIAFITYEFPPDTGKGGIGTYVSQAAAAMAELGFDIHVFAGSNKSAGTKYSGGIYIYHIQCRNANDFRNKVVNVFALQHASLAFDVMESPEINGNAWEIKKRFPEIPLIVRLHAPNYLVESTKKRYVTLKTKLRFVAGSVRRLKFDLGYWKPYDRSTDEDYQFIQLADHITAASEAMKEWAVNNWQIAPGNIYVIPNIFSPPVSLLDIPILKELTYKRIVFFGRLNVLKGLVNATIAMKKILKEYPDWQFRIIGDDGPGPNIHISMGSWMQRKLKEVIGQVEFMDGLPYKELPILISPCEIVLLPSLFESFSYTCAEAMAAGKAVVGSNNGGMADLLQNNKSGMLINPEKQSEVYAAIKKIITGNSCRYELSVNARARILNDFDAKKTALKYKSLYEQVATKQFAEN